MRPTVPILAATALALIGYGVVSGGRLLQQERAEAALPAATAIAVAEPTEPAAPAALPAPVVKRTAIASRLIAPKIVAPPALDSEDLVWAAPRAPLSELSQALPPKPEPLSNILFRPLAVESAVVEVAGRKVAIAGTGSVGVDETCDFEGKSWVCGVHARTAFRMWLRGRALHCDLPPDANGDVVTTACVIGKQDAGQWLVSNGWARAAAGGPYAEAQSQAQAAKKGIFGPPPDTSGLGPIPEFTASTSPADQPVLPD